ncbi:MAG: hypothetical protein NXI02_32310, partial [Rhodobacteraceae bacterium]|nr:hypothetical protein [Paracoccaceae bacterium]
MAKDIVFVLHGMGEHSDDWMTDKAGAIPALKDAAKNYPFFESASLDTYVEFVPILYDDIFRKIIANWTDQANGLKKSIPVMPGLPDKVLTFMQSLDDNDWESTHAGDVVLYWGFRLFQQRVSLRVIKQIVDKVNQTATAGDSVPDYHILATSLGTAVAQDALHHLGTETWLEGLAARQVAEIDEEYRQERADLLVSLDRLKEEFGTSNPFAPGLFGFESVAMLSNVSGLVFGTEPPGASIVRPGTASEHGAYTKHYLNVNHVADPVSLATQFRAPPDWELSGGYKDLTFNHFFPIEGIDTVADVASRIHSAAHYVANPDLHLRLLMLYVNPYRP